MQFLVSFPYFLVDFRGIHGDSPMVTISHKQLQHNVEKHIFVSVVILPAAADYSYFKMLYYLQNVSHY